MDAIRSTLSQGGPFKTHDMQVNEAGLELIKKFTLSQGGPFKTHDTSMALVAAAGELDLKSRGPFQDP